MIFRKMASPAVLPVESKSLHVPPLQEVAQGGVIMCVYMCVERYVRVPIKWAYLRVTYLLCMCVCLLMLLHVIVNQWR